MTTFRVKIPDNKKSFFLEFLKLLGVQYEEGESLDFELTDEQKKILDQQQGLEISQYEDNDAFLEDLKREHGL